VRKCSAAHSLEVKRNGLKLCPQDMLEESLSERLVVYGAPRGFCFSDALCATSLGKHVDVVDLSEIESKIGRLQSS